MVFSFSDCDKDGDKKRRVCNLRMIGEELENWEAILDNLIVEYFKKFPIKIFCYYNYRTHSLKCILWYTIDELFKN